MIVRFSLPVKQRARLLQERREAQKAADVFARVCEEGDATRLCYAAQSLNECVSTPGARQWLRSQDCRA